MILHVQAYLIIILTLQLSMRASCNIRTYIYIHKCVVYNYCQTRTIVSLLLDAASLNWCSLLYTGIEDSDGSKQAT